MKPIHLMKADDRKHTIETHHLWVDTGLSPLTVKSSIAIGDPVAFAPNMKQLEVLSRRATASAPT